MFCATPSGDPYPNISFFIAARSCCLAILVVALSCSVENDPIGSKNGFADLWTHLWVSTRTFLLQQYVECTRRRHGTEATAVPKMACDSTLHCCANMAPFVRSESQRDPSLYIAVGRRGWIERKGGWRDIPGEPVTLDMKEAGLAEGNAQVGYRTEKYYVTKAANVFGRSNSLHEAISGLV